MLHMLYIEYSLDSEMSQTPHQSFNIVELPLELFVRMNQSIFYYSCSDCSIPNDYRIAKRIPIDDTTR